MKNKFEEGLNRYLKPRQIEKIKKTRVGIAGCGGLGSCCAINLARCGFCDFIIADFDSVDASNLNRQYFFYDQIGKPKVNMIRENLLKINPDIHTDTLSLKLTEDNILDVFQTCDVIIEAFDELQGKIMIVKHYMQSEKLLVSASGIAGFGNSDRIITKKIKKGFYIVGDFITEATEKTPPFGPCVSIAAAKQADVVLSCILEGELS